MSRRWPPGGETGTENQQGRRPQQHESGTLYSAAFFVSHDPTSGRCRAGAKLKKHLLGAKVSVTLVPGGVCREGRECRPAYCRSELLMGLWQTSLGWTP
ncbi:hypothetical protein GN956_G13840 [Arapaima gigas]